MLVQLYICLLKFALVTLINCALSKFESYFKLKRNTYLSYLWPNWNISSDLAFTAGRLFLALTPAYFDCIISPPVLYRLVVLYRLLYYIASLMRTSLNQSSQGSTPSLRIREHLTRKYNIHFNFALATPLNQLLFNSLTLATVRFKDALIYVDQNQYLKRCYLLKNSQGKDQVFDRIRLLAQFYGTAVLLRYEYPTMVLTKTKAVFLKRLKRLKNALAERGSSDESKSNNQQKIVSIDSSRFLKSLSSSELQRKSLDQANRIDLDFSIFEECEVYEIFEDPAGQQESVALSGELSRNGNIGELARQELQQLLLSHQLSQSQLRHLVSDFDYFDPQEVFRRYKQLSLAQDKAANPKSLLLHKDSIKSAKSSDNNRLQRLKSLDKKPMASSVTITKFQNKKFNLYFSANQNADSFKKKSQMPPSSPKISQLADKHDNHSPKMKKSNYCKYELGSRHNERQEEPIAEFERQDSPKHLSSYKLINSQAQGYGFMSSRQPNSRDREFTNSRDREYTKKTQKTAFPITKYSSIISPNELKTQSKIFSKWQVQHQEKGSPYKAQQPNCSHPYPGYQCSHPYPGYQCSRPYPGYQRSKYSGQQNRMTSINININNLQEQKERVKLKVGKLCQAADEEKNQKAEKKKKLREKAVALLNRVKSQEYIKHYQPYQQPQFPQNRPYIQRFYN